MIGLTGPQRVGKTTLAQAFADASGLPFLATTASGVFEMLDLDPKKEYPIEVRLMVQEVILQMFESQYEEMTRQSPVFITDRTPIDLASYALADVTRATFEGKPLVAKAMNDYVQRCLKSASRFFTVVVHVQPGIPLIEAEGKAPACPAYMEHLNALQTGLMHSENNLVRSTEMPRRLTDLQDRKEFLANVLQTCMDMQKLIKKANTFH